MKTLILNGSPRKNGETAGLIQALNLPGEVTVVDGFSARVSPCVDCRYCRSHAGCRIQDGMQELYRKIEESDALVLASPIWFGTLPGPLLTLASRIQTYFSAHFFRKEKKRTGKKGAVILTAGGTGGEKSAYRTACIILRELGVEGEIPLVTSLQTDRFSARDDEKALQELQKIREYFK